MLNNGLAVSAGILGVIVVLGAETRGDVSPLEQLGSDLRPFDASPYVAYATARFPGEEGATDPDPEELNAMVQEVCTRCHNDQMLAGGHSLEGFTIDKAPELLEQAEALDREREAGNIRSPLHGVTVSIKDVIHVKGMPTASGSRVMEGYMPQDDATAVRKLREAGAVITGKTHTHEFALGVTTSQSRNPWDITRDPGGSSGGSAISVATGMSLLSLGTDTRASIRVPAALCGIVGYKPTYGLVSTDGVVTLSWSMDHVGLQGRCCEDVAMMMNVL